MVHQVVLFSNSFQPEEQGNNSDLKDLPTVLYLNLKPFIGHILA